LVGNNGEGMEGFKRQKDTPNGFFFKRLVIHATDVIFKKWLLGLAFFHEWIINNMID